MIYIAVWTVAIYAPVAHWVWGPDGWLAALGTVDYAGGLVVEIVSGSRPSLGPRGEPAGEQERHLLLAECSRDALDALLDVSEGLFFRHH